MLHIDELIVVEGKYDKEHLKKLTDAPIVCTNGFELYRSKAIIDSIKAYGKKRGVIVLTDSDRAGFRIRNYIKQCVGDICTVKQAYIPEIKGKEKRKEKAGKDGILGVEGIDEKILEEILLKVAKASEGEPLKPVEKSEFYADGFSGKPYSAELRKKLAKELNLPTKISANALLEMVNKICGYDEYKTIVDKIAKIC